MENFIVLTYNPWLVALSIAIAVGTSYTALDLAARIAHETGRAKWEWLVGGAIVMGLGVWTMHFVGMLAVHFPFPVGFDLTLTLASMLPAIGAAAFALYLLQRPDFGWRRLMVGGLVMGGGIGAMHYIGMAAMQMLPPIRYDPWLFALSVIFAAAAATVALRFAARQAAKEEHVWWHRFAGAGTMGMAIVGMHYVAMGAARVAPGSVCVSGLIEPAMGSTYNPWLVALSVTIAIFASYTALDLAARLRVAEGGARWNWLGGGALALGLGIWSMHFIGMLAFKLPISIGYDVKITLLSLLPAILAAGVALWVIQSGKVNPRVLGLSGLVMGAGIGGMHYSGMAAMDISPPLRYDPTLFVLSVLFAVAAAVTALWAAFNHRLKEAAVCGHIALRKFGSAAVMGLTISGMHYIGMTATHIAPHSVAAYAQGDVAPHWLATFVGVGTTLVLLLAYLAAFFDARMAELRAQVIQRLATKNEELTSRANELALAMTAELRASSVQKRLFATVVDQSADAIVTTDHHGKVTGWNPAATHMFGYTEQEMLGTELARLHPPGESWLPAGGTQLVGAPTYASGDLRTKDQRLLHASMSRAPLNDEEGMALGEISILRDMTEQRAAQEALRESNARLHELSEHLQRAREHERTRIARELHDELGSTLTAISLYLGRADKPGDRPDTADPVERARQLVESATLTLRRITTALRPAALDHFGAWPAIEGLARETEQSCGLVCQVSVTQGVRDLPLDEEQASAIFRIAQEALNNVVRHSRARRVHIDAALDGAFLILKINDDGIGFDPGREQERDSWGIIGMQERVRALGGELTLNAEPGGGTTLTARVPMSFARRTPPVNPTKSDRDSRHNALNPHST